MFEWFRNLFGRGTIGDGGGGRPHLPNTNTKWIPASENTFGIDVLDCSAFCQSMVSSSDNLEIVGTFGQLRSSLGEQYQGQLPDNSKSAECYLTYPYDGKHADGVLFKAQEMEEKWDIYLYENKIYFARSWTGKLIYVADFRFDSDFVVLTSVTADAKRSSDLTYAIASVDYLMKSHIYRCLLPHPLPKEIPDDPDEIAFFSFGQYGRLAGFASFEDTTQIRNPPAGPRDGG